MANSRGLGRGLEALFDGGSSAAPERDGPVAAVALDSINTNPNQPRKTFDQEKLEELAASIREQGILQPLVVRPAREEGRYELIAGERRLRASRMAGLDQVPVMIRQMSDHDALICTLMENLQRDDLNPIEEARGMQALKEALECTVEELAARLGQGRSSIFHALRLLKLDESLQEDVIAGRLSASHAKAIAGLEDPGARLSIRQYIMEHDLTVRATEQAVNQFLGMGQFPWDNQMINRAPGQEEAGDGNQGGDHDQGRPESGADLDHGAAEGAANGEQGSETPENGEIYHRSVRQPMIQSPEIARLARDIGAALNCRARITGTQEKGNISIAYDSTEQLNELLEKMGISLGALSLPPLTYE